MAVWKEQATTIPVPGDDLVLEGVWQAGGRGGAVIAPPHPEYGGSLENPVVNEIAYGLHKADTPSLRFNWRGVGGSQGEISAASEAADLDYRAALEQIAETTGPPIFACGYSFGAAAAFRVALADPRIERVILVAPSLALLAGVPLEDLERPLHVIVGGRDEFSPAAELSGRLAELPTAQLEVLPGIDHFFTSGGLAQIAEFVRNAADA